MRPSTDVSASTGLVQSDLACILVHALAERESRGVPLTESLGLAPAQLDDLVQTWFPGLDLPDVDPPEPVRSPEQESLTLLLLWRGGVKTAEAHWLAAIIARRALEPRHLWEDLGLPSRAALGALMALHFPRLAAANTANMRWKKFLYRQICDDSALTLCLAPSCDECAERPECFAPEAPDVPLPEGPGTLAAE